MEDRCDDEGEEGGVMLRVATACRLALLILIAFAADEGG